MYVCVCVYWGGEGGGAEEGVHVYQGDRKGGDRRVKGKGGNGTGDEWKGMGGGRGGR